MSLSWKLFCFSFVGANHSGELRKKFLEITFYGVKLTFLTPDVFEEEGFFFIDCQVKPDTQLLLCACHR